MFLPGVIVIVCFFLIAAVLLTRGPRSNVTAIVSPVAKEITDLEFVDLDKESELLTLLEQELRNVSGEYGIVVLNLKTGEEVRINDKRTFQTASLYKLWVAAVVFEQIEKGTLSESRVLSESVEELNEIYDIASESAEQTEGEIGGTVEDLVERMITVSDNYSAYLLGTTVGMSNVRKFLEDGGYRDSAVGSPPHSTAYDIALFFEKLYRGRVVSKPVSQKLLEVLKRQRLNDRLPALLPENTVVAHKTGELGAFKHDAGIVFSEQGDYVIVVLSETPSQEVAVSQIAEISRIVFEYFEKQKE